jgi:VWFA-related protein
MTLLRTIACIVVVAAQAGQPPASTPSQPARAADVIRLGIDLVRVDATVTDERGRHVPDLSATDFELLQNGRLQTISTFDYVRLDTIAGNATTPPSRPFGPAPSRPLAADKVRRTIALVVDDLGLTFASTLRTRAVLQRFLDTQMQPGDLVAILRTGAGMGALQQFTSDRRALQAAVDRVRWNMTTRASLFETSGESDILDKFRTEVLSAGTLGAVRYVIRGLSELPGRKSVVLLSDGFRLTDADGNYGRVFDALRSVVDAANRAGVVVYGIDMRGLAATGPSASDKTASAAAGREDELRATQDGLGVIAGETGGLFMRNTNDLTSALERVLEDHHGYYLLGYVPESSTFSGAKPRFHKLQVRVKRPGLRVRSRSGFLSVPDERARMASPQNRMIGAATSPFAGGEIRLLLSSFFGHDQKYGAFVSSVMHVDARDLTFTESAQGARAADIEILAMTFGENGQIADQTSRRYTFTLTPIAYAQAVSVGLVYRMQVPLKRPGPYQLRIALRDVASDRIGSASRFIDVPDVRKGRLTLSGLVIDGVSQTATTAEGQDTRDPRSTVAVRVFRQGTSASYVCSVYNARQGSNGAPQLETEVRLYREGIEAFRNAQRGMLPVADSAYPLVGGVLNLNASTPPGAYVLELTVVDRLAKKPARATQTIDFDVIQ